MLAHYWKTNEVKRRRQKNIQNKAVQTKLNIYQQIHEKGNITNILIQSVEYSSVCVCVCICVTNTNIMEKD